MKALLIACTVATALLAAAENPARAESPSKNYLLHCWGCHREKGEGIPNTVPPLAGMGRFLSVPGGRAYLVQVPGVSISSLSNAEAAEVLNWLLVNYSRDELPRNFSPYTAAEVGRYRARKLKHVGRTRESLIARIKARSPRR